MIHAVQVVCTLGPKSRDVPVLEELLRAGMSVARFNFSHGSHEYHQVCANIGPIPAIGHLIPAAAMMLAGDARQPAQGDVQHQDYVRRNAGYQGRVHWDQGQKIVRGPVRMQVLSKLHIMHIAA